MRQATEFKQEAWETFGGAAALIIASERRKPPHAYIITKESSDRGRNNSIASQRAAKAKRA